eukprot:TRINITY_DN267_c0_g2_i4.p1 TRINITY_DN267_c0_g2~~TRINITY_DN267_c0_g2_i4.p1  ORF type:complete len:1421 (-),score=259.62 TRINITY_DN267_c0_g2_i4:61-4323(-)
MELIQNADDNDYADGVVPELSITLLNRSLLIACNEVGFNKQNVDAICGINASTKVGKKNEEEGYVGEKGIGFKSVFKVADVVWISSGHYSFKFDKNTKLGMIAPFWEKFPQPKREGYTQFLLKLSETSDVQVVVDVIKKELLDLRPTLLLFLRRLRVINIKLPSHEPIRLSCTSTPSKMILSKNGLSTDYIVLKHYVTNMPSEEKRKGIKKTRILLAFPMTRENGELVTSKQDVFAFLPIRSFGFTFMIQADFLLVASREGIDQSKEWNKCILRGIVEAFVTAVGPSVKPSLKYLWPLFLPQDVNDSFLKPLETEILQTLRKEKVLLSDKDGYENPSSLQIIPAKYRLDNTDDGQVMFDDYKPVSSGYPTSTHSKLKLLGVQTETREKFLEKLKNVVTKNGSVFGEKPEEWHKRLAYILTTEFAQHEIARVLRYAKAVPLTNKEWASPDHKTIFFERSDVAVAIPEGLDIFTVDPVAAKDQARRTLFQYLGVKECNVQQICEAILSKHESLEGTRTIDHFVQHVKFLFSSRRTLDRNVNSSRIWFVDSQRKLVRGSELYLDDPNILSLKDYFQDYQEVRYPHDLYFDSIEDTQKKDWFDWLRERFDIQSVPRLVKKGYPHSITPEFKHIMNTCPPQKVLDLLKDKYSFEDLYGSVCKEIGNLLVICKDGNKRPLNSTYLPIQKLMRKVPFRKALDSSFIDVSKPAEWCSFTKFGLKMEDDFNFYLNCLRSLTTRQSAPPHEQLSQIYQEIKSQISDQKEKEKFLEEALIYLPSSTKEAGTWFKSNQCLWQAPTCLRRAQPLNKIYKNLKGFFKDTLRIRNANLQDIIQELKTHPTNPTQIQELFAELNEHFKKEPDENLQSLKNLPIFPIRSITRSESKIVSGTDSKWFIGDRNFLRTVFEKSVYLLDFPLETILEMLNLFKALDLEQKFLSIAMKTSMKFVGVPTKCEICKEIIEGATPNILRIMPADQRELAFQQLSNVNVFAVKDVVLERYVMIGKMPIKGTPSSGVVFDVKKTGKGEEELNIYIPLEDLQPDRFPPYQLCEEFQKLFRINAKHRLVIDMLLRTKDPLRIEQILDQNGFIQTLVPVKSKSPDDLLQDTEFEEPSFQSNQKHQNATDDLSVSSPPPRPSSTKKALDESRNGDQVKNQSFQPKVSSSGKSHGVESNGRLDVGHIGENFTVSDPKRAANSHGSTAASIETECVGEGVRQVRMTMENSVHRNDVNSSSTKKKSSPQNTSAAARLSDFVAEQKDPEQTEEDTKTGIQGETYMFEFLKSVDKSFNYLIWTSNLREKAGFAPFMNDAEFADFTVVDKKKQLARRLFKGKELPSEPITFHIEVKATTGPLKSPFFMSYPQSLKARNYTFGDNLIPLNVYVIARVFNVFSGTPKCHFIVDPWKEIYHGALTLQPFSGPFVATVKLE